MPNTEVQKNVSLHALSLTVIPSSRCAEAEDVNIKNPCFQLSKILHNNMVRTRTSNKLTFMHADAAMPSLL